MGSFTRSTHIARPPQEVWDYCINFDNAVHWITGVDQIEVVTDGPTTLGTKFRETRTLGRRTEMHLIEITAFEPPAVYSATARISGGEVTYTYTLREVAGGTEVTLRGEVRGNNLLFKVFAPIGLAMMRKFDGDQLDRLKAAIERS